MKTKFVIITTIILLLAIGLSGCEETQIDKRFIGKWIAEKYEYPSYTFYANNTYSIPGIKGTWNVQDGLLVLKYDNSTEKYNFVFSSDNKTLTLTGLKEGIERVYFKPP